MKQATGGSNTDVQTLMPHKHEISTLEVAKSCRQGAHKSTDTNNFNNDLVKHFITFLMWSLIGLLSLFLHRYRCVAQSNYSRDDLCTSVRSMFGNS